MLHFVFAPAQFGLPVNGCQLEIHPFHIPYKNELCYSITIVHVYHIQNFKIYIISPLTIETIQLEIVFTSINLCVGK